MLLIEDEKGSGACACAGAGAGAGASARTVLLLLLFLSVAAALPDPDPRFTHAQSLELSGELSAGGGTGGVLHQSNEAFTVSASGRPCPPSHNDDEDPSLGAAGTRAMGNPLQLHGRSHDHWEYQDPFVVAMSHRMEGKKRA